MKRLIILFFIVIIFRISSNNYIYNGYDIELGKNYILENKVNFREKPNLSSNIISQLNMGDTIDVIKNAGNIIKVNNISDNWYFIKYNNKFGFIWGGLISDIGYNNDFDNDKKNEILLYKKSLLSESLP